MLTDTQTPDVKVPMLTDVVDRCDLTTTSPFRWLVNLMNIMYWVLEYLPAIYQYEFDFGPKLLVN